MTAQDDKAVGVMPQNDNVTTPPQTPVDPATLPQDNVVVQPDSTVAPLSIEDLDTSRGQQISGPDFTTSVGELPTGPSPSVVTNENASGSMSDLISPTPVTPLDTSVDTSPVMQPLDTPQTNPISDDPMATSNTTSTPDPLVAEGDENRSSDDTQLKSEEKKESPLQALARKLSELKSELVEEVDEKTESPVNAPLDQPLPPTDESTPVLNDPMASVADASNLPGLTDMPAPNPGAVDTSVFPTSTPDQPVGVDTNQTGVSVESLQPELNDVQTPVSEISLDTPLPSSIVPEATVDTITAPELENTPMLDSAPAPTSSDAQTSVVEPSVPDIADPSFDPLSQFQNDSQSNQVEVENQPILAENTDGLSTTDTVVGQEQTPNANEALKNTEALDSTAVDQGAMEPESGSGVLDESNVGASSTVVEGDDPGVSDGKYPININKILDIAIDRGASDVHITVGYPVMIRIDGSLLAIHDKVVTEEESENLIFPLLTEQKKELLEVNREVDFAHTHRHGGEARFRINAFYTRQNLSAALRLIPTRIRTIEELNLPGIYAQFAGLKQGLVLVTGPTGHGKSTTLAAILQHVNTNRSVHLLTIEDPIEYIFPKAKAVVDQREMHDDTHSWAVALKSALRQDPDVILVGEMRDYETIAATITLAETGHLVFATLHTNSAAQTIDRIIDVFPENQQGQVRAQLSNILEAVIAQRLLPVDGGGRRAVSEIMLGSSAVRNLIREGKTHQLDNVIRTSADIGMVSLEHSLVKLVREGLITMDKAQEYAVHPEEVVRLLKS